jgi:hypothetical protein
MSCSFSTSAFAPAASGGMSAVARGAGVSSLAASDGQSGFRLMAATTSEDIIPREVLFGNPKYAGKSLPRFLLALFSNFSGIRVF